MSDDEKNPAREVITDYAQAHFRYFRTADGTVYAQSNGHPVARPIRSQGTTGSHRQELMVGLFRDGKGVFNGTALKEALDLIEALALYRGRAARPHPRRTRRSTGPPGSTSGATTGSPSASTPPAGTSPSPTRAKCAGAAPSSPGNSPCPPRTPTARASTCCCGLCNFATAETECLAIAWLIGCLGPSVPVPAPFLTGPQGAGKSTGGRMLVRIVEGMTRGPAPGPEG